jgi:hypothetical protein
MYVAKTPNPQAESKKETKKDPYRIGLSYPSLSVSIIISFILLSLMA